MTLHHIAQKANVSTTTVHRVFSGKGDVHPETAKKILKIAKEAGYTPTIRKTGIRNYSESHFKTGIISLLLAGLPMEFLELPQNLKILSYIEQALKSYDLLLSVTHEENENISNLISSNRFDGLILMGDIPPNLKQEVNHFPCIGILGSNYIEAGIDWILPDYRARARISIDYLTNTGHKNIAFFNPIKEHYGFQEVGREFLWVAEQKGINARILSSSYQNKNNFWKPELGRHIVQRMIEELLSIPKADRPTGLFVANDELAMDVYYELHNRNIEIGKDISIISSDNIDIYLNRISPRPATIDVNYPEIAQLAVERLIKRIQNPGIDMGLRILVPQKLILPDKKM